MSYVSEHYFRVFAKVKKGKSIASKTVKDNLGYINYCSKCLWRKIDKNPITNCGACESKTKIIGKVWIGKIEDLDFIQKCKEKLSEVSWLNTEKRIKKILDLLGNEQIPLYYDVHKICEKHGLRIPQFDSLIEELKNKGYFAERTHFWNKGIKTDVPLEFLIISIKSS